jgi:transposase
VLFLDEFTYYHWPLVGRAWWPRQGTPPGADRAGRSNTTRRIVATLDACSGRVLAHQDGHITKDVFARFLAKVATAYPQAERIIVVLDNWPVHTSPEVAAAVDAIDRLELLFLPTDAPWLNPIEKLWALLKDEVLRLHPYAGRWTELKATVTRFLARYADGSPDLLVQVGLRGSGALALALQEITDFHSQS